MRQPAARARLLWSIVAAVVAFVTITSVVYAQRWRGRYPIRQATAESFDGRFNFCRVMFRSGRFGDGGRWSVDYPRADINLSIRLSELTRVPVSMDAANDPNHVVVDLTDPMLFRCPFVMMTEVGSAYFDELEAERLREYLLKGGFLWVDDFWGSRAWEHWANEISKVLPPGQFPVVDLTLEHDIFRMLFDVQVLPQIPSINFWAGSGGRTSERGSDSAQPQPRAIVDPAGRIMVFMTHNTDIGDSWEREADDPGFFYRFSVDGYAVGINAVLYALTH